MNNKVALLIIYNHRFDKNIIPIQRLYSKKFSNIFHIIPFYDGEVEGVNIIPVYENSFRFQGYISQAYTHLKDKGFSHFLIIADDMILNPIMDENNIWEKCGVDKNECFIPADLIILQKLKGYWNHLSDALNYKVSAYGAEVKNILPSKEDAYHIFNKFGLPTNAIPLRTILFPKIRNRKMPVMFKNIIKQWKSFVFGRKFNRNLDYPLVGCYSDALFVTSEVMSDFCTYCGAFAATGLFVEIAIPTSLILCTNRIKFDRDLKLHYGAYWPHEMKDFENRYQKDLDVLLNDFPRDSFFVHPVKLSKWKWSNK